MTSGGRARHQEPDRLGVLDVICDALLVPETDQRLVIYSAAPGSREPEVLSLLRVIGMQSSVTEQG